MGWSCATKPSDFDTKDFLINHINCDNDSARWTVLDYARKLNTVYMAVERVAKSSGERIVYALVILMEFHHGEKYNFCWKELSEEEGPYESECPRRILDLLTEPRNQDAIEWRERCRKAATVISVGARFRSEQGLRFGDGVVRHLFTVERRGICVAEDGRRVKLPRRTLLSLERLSA